ncbi:hypothetical protein [Salinibacter ruber]|uniref:Uncharacterized protein n=1 Tax=Salinibacter ruber TaxID=146919 RepID=A0A9X2UL33_9BACT|nr:hypothetical protein [Salinibacter ruber]MCS3611734.1 hypothetical protein [Salinibacter ruber]MCS3613829.1 hypothetical protein [Salinibacter ruber]MCS3645812.1 hypothetical protein [Salinibacter ruber]MCS3673558.1 hypothetical protein [Salinibacter ruber]MCS3782793.1 hypothetical protein [Salinibacter ruber]
MSRRGEQEPAGPSGAAAGTSADGTGTRGRRTEKKLLAIGYRQVPGHFKPKLQDLH